MKYTVKFQVYFLLNIKAYFIQEVRDLAKRTTPSFILHYSRHTEWAFLTVATYNLRTDHIENSYLDPKEGLETRFRAGIRLF